MKYYHIITQSYYGKNILPEIEDCVAYLQLVAKAFQKYEILWLAYAIMPNHIHLAVAMPTGNEEENKRILAKARRKIACGYTAYARKNHPELFSREKQIFQSRNQLKFLQTAYDVKQVIRYLNLNPLRKDLEKVPGQTVRSSHQAILSLWDPQDRQNPFNCFAELTQIRNALAAEEIFRLFGRNRNEQKQNYVAFHAQPLQESQSANPPASTSASISASTTTNGQTSASQQKAADLQKAEQILQWYFSQAYPFQGKIFTPENRQAFLRWLNRQNNIAHKRAVVMYINKRTSLSTREIAQVLNTSSTTVKRMLKGAVE